MESVEGDPIFSYILTKDEAKAKLEEYADWLAATDVEDAWYRIAYHMRALIAAYRTGIRKKSYLDKVKYYCDRLVKWQHDTGSWPSGARSKSGWDSRNIADLGSMVTILLLVYDLVDYDRQVKYLAAARRWLEEWVEPCILSGTETYQPGKDPYGHPKYYNPNPLTLDITGALSNGLWYGKFWYTAYSCATATVGEAAAFYAVLTGNKEFMDIAEKGAKFLLRNWGLDGKPPYFKYDEIDHWRDPVTQFGDNYYDSEIIGAVYCYTRDKKLKEKIEEVYHNFVEGTGGLIQAVDPNTGYWICKANWQGGGTVWEYNKSVAMPTVLVDYYYWMKPSNRNAVNNAIQSALHFITTPSRYGTAPYGLELVPIKNTLNAYGCSTTGFATLSLAEYIKPGVIFKVVPPVNHRIPKYINFQEPFTRTEDCPDVPVGYERDAGKTQKDGSILPTREYGWFSSVPVIKRGINPDYKKDTFVYSSSATWEIRVPNGAYYITVCAGDPSSAHHQKIIVEGETVIDKNTAVNEFTIDRRKFIIRDGKIVMVIGDGHDTTTVNCIKIDIRE